MANTKYGSNKTYVDPLERNEETSQGFFDQLFGKDNRSSERPLPSFQKSPEKSPKIREEFSIFTRVDHQEKYENKKKIEELKEIILNEVKELKKSNTAVITEIKNIEHQAMQTSEAHTSVYHVRFLETLLSMIRLLRQKVSEAGTWLQAINTRRAKRGSAGMATKVHKNQNEEHRAHRSASQ